MMALTFCQHKSVAACVMLSEFELTDEISIAFVALCAVFLAHSDIW